MELYIKGESKEITDFLTSIKDRQESSEDKTKNELSLKVSLPEMSTFDSLEKIIKKIPVTFNDDYKRIRVEADYCDVS